MLKRWSWNLFKLLYSKQKNINTNNSHESNRREKIKIVFAKIHIFNIKENFCGDYKIIYDVYLD